MSIQWQALFLVGGNETIWGGWQVHSPSVALRWTHDCMVCWLPGVSSAICLWVFPSWHISIPFLLLLAYHHIRLKTLYLKTQVTLFHRCNMNTYPSRFKYKLCLPVCPPQNSKVQTYEGIQNWKEIRWEQYQWSLTWLTRTQGLIHSAPQWFSNQWIAKGVSTQKLL